MPNINKQITLTTKGSNAGPLFDVYYSSDCVNYTICIDGNNVSLPTVGSTAIVTVPDTTICIKLINQSSVCEENYIVSGSTTTTTTSTTTSTTTIAPTTTTTTFSSNPCICTEIVVTSAPAEVATFNCYSVNQNYVYFSTGTYYLCAASLGGLLQAEFISGTGTVSPVGNCKTGACPPASTTTTTAPPTTTTTTIACADCGINQFGSYTPSNYYAYPDTDICNAVSSSNNLQYYAYDRPNRFTLYDSSGYITSSGWVGYADYAGPWGASLNVDPDGIIPFTFNSGTGRYMRVEAGPADTENPISDAYEWVLVCQNPTTTTTTTTVAPTTTTTSALYVYNDGGYGNSEAGACNDASNMRTLYSTCSSGAFGNGCNVYLDAGGNNPLTGYTYVFMNGALWDINSSTGVIIVYSSVQC
jgi:hypothetical protein